MIVILTLAAVGLLGWLFYLRPHWAFPAVVFFLPFERLGAYALNTATGRPVVRIVQVMIAAMLIGALARLVLKTKQIYLSKLLLPLGLFAVIAFVAAALPQYSQLWSSYGTLLAMVGLVIIVSGTLDQHTNDLAYWALIASASAVCLFGLYQFVGDLAGLSPVLTGLHQQYTKIVLGFPRVQSTAQEPLYFANYLLIPMFVIGWKWLNSQLSLPRGELGVLMLVTLTFLLTVSRGAFIGTAIAALIGLVVFRPKDAWRHKFINITLSCAVLATVAISLLALSSKITNNSWLAGPKYFYELSSSKLTKSVSFTEREYTRKLALDVWEQSPLFGVGIGGIGPYLHNYPATYTHETSVSLNIQAFDLLAEVGLVGFAAYYFFLAALLTAAWRSYRHKQDWLVGALAVALIAITVQAQSFSGFLIAHTWVLLGWLLAAVRLSQRPGNAKDPLWPERQI